jgi:hypothetical protein
MAEIRCENKKFGEITPDGILEIFCSSNFCKDHRSDEVAMHRWDTRKISADGTVKFIETKRFKKPFPERKMK